MPKYQKKMQQNEVGQSFGKLQNISCKAPKKVKRKTSFQTIRPLDTKHYIAPLNFQPKQVPLPPAPPLPPFLCPPPIQETFHVLHNYKFIKNYGRRKAKIWEVLTRWMRILNSSTKMRVPVSIFASLVNIFWKQGEGLVSTTSGPNCVVHSTP